MFEEIKEIIVETLNVDDDKVTMDARLAEDLGADSLDAVELAMAVEDKYGITIKDEEMENIKTVADMVRIVEDNR